MEVPHPKDPILLGGPNAPSFGSRSDTLFGMLLRSTPMVASQEQPNCNNLIGRSYADVVACAGIPESQADVGVRTGAGLYRMQLPGGFFCDSTLLVKEGRVVSVTEREVEGTDLGERMMWRDHELCIKRFESCLSTR
jgi:hypothetical protein